MTSQCLRLPLQFIKTLTARVFIRRRVCSLLKKALVVIDVTTLKMARKPVNLPKEDSAGCAGEGEQSKGN